MNRLCDLFGKPEALDLGAHGLRPLAQGTHRDRFQDHLAFPDRDVEVVDLRKLSRDGLGKRDLFLEVFLANMGARLVPKMQGFLTWGKGPSNAD